MNSRRDRTALYRERLIELRDPTDGVIPNTSEVFSLLQQLRKQKGYQAVARGRRSEPDGIEW
ncbi:uncharacterized protein N7503_000771 [Penicillium pulvis]|uniref:uncharacterized protein n=1 Tax=Penicillium pulvis TaxID=1562058 RepID=UPI002546BA7C|nr:uncharacterized protein N7503_000771 [Penicillium pulvis]KAJ5814021.1 hypothetical protein N7503_000771 [Penicillium pulvis]